MTKAGKSNKARTYVVAKALLEDKSAADACREAGYSESTVKSKAYEIAEKPEVKAAMLEIERTIKPGDLGRMSKTLLQNELLSPPESVRDKLSLIRLGLEVDKMVGPTEQLHLHQHNLPPVVEKLLLEKMQELLQVRQESTIDAEVIENTESQVQS